MEVVGMAKCPKCGKEIEELLYYAYELNHAHAFVGEGGLEYHNWDTLPDVRGDPDYECPECGAVLAHSEEEAERFLKSRA
jgi:hypothetical protein